MLPANCAKSYSSLSAESQIFRSSDSDAAESLLMMVGAVARSAGRLHTAIQVRYDISLEPMYVRWRLTRSAPHLYCCGG